MILEYSEITTSTLFCIFWIDLCINVSNFLFSSSMYSSLNSPGFTIFGFISLYNSLKTLQWHQKQV